MESETIFALSSGAGVRAGVSVIRVSGPQARDVLERMCPGKGPDAVPAARRAVLRALRWPSTASNAASGDTSGMDEVAEGAASGDTGGMEGAGSMEGAGPHEAGELIDKALVLWFEGPNSFTGEVLIETP